MKSKVLVGVALAIWAVAGPAVASTITYTDFGIGSGTLNGVSFTNSLVEVSFTGDTSTITNSPLGLYRNIAGTGSVRVAGVGADSLLHPEVFSNQGQKAAGIGDYFVDASILGTFNAAFASYALDAIGPTSGRSFIRSDLTFGTSLGSFQISSFAATSTFTAESVPVPLPVLGGGLPGLMLAGGGLLGWWRRKRKAKARA